MKKILITGCAGFIGSHLTKKLLQEGYIIFGIDNFNNYYKPQFKHENIQDFKNNINFKLYEQDILNLSSLEEIFEENEPEAVIHLAARAGVRPSIMQPILYEEVNIKGSLNMLEMAKKYNIKKFVFASSSSVYGNQSMVPFSESDEVNNPISPYAATKKAGEMLCYTYSYLYNIPTVCLRFFTAYGPNGRPDMAPYIFTEAIIKGKEITKYGDGASSRDYTYIDDIVQGVIASMKYKTNYDIFNLGNSNPVTLNEFISTIEKIIGKKAIIMKKPIQPGDVNKTYANIEKAKKLLNYEPKTNLEEGLTNLINWYIDKRLMNPN